MANVNVCRIYSRIFIQFVLILQKLAAHLNQHAWSVLDIHKISPLIITFFLEQLRDLEKGRTE